MYKLIVIDTYSSMVIEGTQITCLATYQRYMTSQYYVALALYDESGVLINFSAQHESLSNVA